jgi:hypothetical protein
MKGKTAVICSLPQVVSLAVMSPHNWDLLLRSDSIGILQENLGLTLLNKIWVSSLGKSFHDMFSDIFPVWSHRLDLDKPRNRLVLMVFYFLWNPRGHYYVAQILAWDLLWSLHKICDPLYYVIRMCNTFILKLFNRAGISQEWIRQIFLFVMSIHKSHSWEISRWIDK